MNVTSTSCPVVNGSNMPLPNQFQPKVLYHFIRHAQSEANVYVQGATIPDAPLTRHGEVQAVYLACTYHPKVSISNNVDLIFSSPMTRAIQTCRLAFGDVAKERNLNINLWDDLKEWGNCPCSIGRPKSVLEERLQGENELYDFNLVRYGWETDFRGRGDHTRAKTHAPRTKEVRRELRYLGNAMIKGGKWKHLTFEPWKEERDVEIVIVSHGGFLASMMGYTDCNFFNAQVKTVRFATEQELRANMNLRMDLFIETFESLARVHDELEDDGENEDEDDE